MKNISHLRKYIYTQLSMLAFNKKIFVFNKIYLHSFQNVYIH